LILEPEDVQEEWKQKYKVIGISSGASTPEESVERILGKLLEGNESATIETLLTVDEDVTFIPPRDLIAAANVR
jgi:4-hydroxy-3-methylbut-2-enyl diphosphate reductase